MRRVLVVEPDAQVAEGMRRALRIFSNAWEVRLVDSADAAVTLALAGEVDAVVCDGGLSGIDALLTQLKDQAPRVARTVLAPAEARPDALARFHALSHQVLRKPMLPALLFDLVGRTMAVIESQTSERLKDVVGRLGDLPPLPATYARLSSMRQDPDASLDSMAAVVERDPAITAAVLRIINSAFFGLPRRVSSVRETVRFLGIVPLRNLVLTVEVFEGLAKGKRALALQQEALLRAYAMRDLLGRSAQSELAFIAGVLSDIGELMLLTKLPIDARAIENAVAEGAFPWDAQVERVGCTSAAIGAQLLARWNLPAALVEAVALQHDFPSGTPTPNVTTALALVRAVEWSERAHTGMKAEFGKAASHLVTAFPSASVESIRRYFTTAEQKAG
jgi:HD-like signal output (HDOD) protein